METTTHADAVLALYDAFGRGDVPAVLALLDDDVSWDADWADSFAQRTSVAHYLPRRGPAQVAEFFQVLGGCVLHSFEVQDVLVSADRVSAVIVIDISLANGGRYRDEEVHLWTFGADGKIVALRHYIDTAKHLAAAAGVDTTAR